MSLACMCLRLYYEIYMSEMTILMIYDRYTITKLSEVRSLIQVETESRTRPFGIWNFACLRDTCD